MRLDLYLVENGFYPTRTKAKMAIEAGDVLVDGSSNVKTSLDIINQKIEIKKISNPYVSRGGLKLEAAIKQFYLDFKDKVVVDIGASTGGFTDCALSFGAKKVYAIDVGSNQLAKKLLNDERVISLEQTNITDIPFFPENIDFLVMDVSFVSIEHLLPDLNRFINESNQLVCLIKPQFEVGRVYMKNGIVKDRTVHIHVIENIIKELEKYNLGIKKICESPILGGSGNKEFLALIARNIKTNINVIELFRKW